MCQRTAREKSVTYLKEVRNDLHDIISTSVPMVVPAGLFVMQQVWHSFPDVLNCLCRKTQYHIFYGRNALPSIQSSAGSTPLYAVQLRALCLASQVLVIVAASHLDAVTFQICSQSFKIMPTALFAVWLLGQYLTPMQWASLPVLAVGVVLVTMNGSAGKPASHSVPDPSLQTKS